MSKISNLSIEWEDVKQKGIEVRTKGEAGQDAWKKIEPGVTKEKTYTISENIKEIIKMVNYVQGAKGDKDVTITIGGEPVVNEITEPAHFFIQHFRIPRLAVNTITHAKLMQIAYNAGQFHACVYHNNINGFYKKHKLGELCTYIE